MSIKNYVFNNFGLKMTAMVVAFFVWAMVAGKEKSYTEQSVTVDVVYTNVPKNINVRSVKPDKVRLRVQGTTRQLKSITAADFKVNIDLTGVTENKPLNYFIEEHLDYPEGMRVLSIHPRMVEVTVREFTTIEVDVRVRYKGRLQPGIKLLERKVVPERVKILGYKSQISGMKTIEAEEMVNLSDIQESVNIRIPLKTSKDILRFEGPNTVEVRIIAKNENIKAEDQKAEGSKKDDTRKEGGKKKDVKKEEVQNNDNNKPRI